jgi:hypothetical protein
MAAGLNTGFSGKLLGELPPQAAYESVATDSQHNAARLICDDVRRANEPA